jgi:hypothetical protein
MTKQSDEQKKDIKRLVKKASLISSDIGKQYNYILRRFTELKNVYGILLAYGVNTIKDVDINADNIIRNLCSLHLVEVDDILTPCVEDEEEPIKQYVTVEPEHEPEPIVEEEPIQQSVVLIIEEIEEPIQQQPVVVKEKPLPQKIPIGLPPCFYDPIEPEPKPVLKSNTKKIEDEPILSTYNEEDYDVFNTFGTYNCNKANLVFKNAHAYKKDLLIIQHFTRDHNLLTKSQIQEQIDNITKPVLIDYLYPRSITTSQDLYDLNKVYGTSNTNDKFMEIYDRTVKMDGDLNDVLDILARCHYSLEESQYKQFLKDIITYISPKFTGTDRFKIIKNFYISYKHISSSRMRELIDKYVIDDYCELMTHVNDYIILKQDEDYNKMIEDETTKREKEERAFIKRQRKQQEEAEERERYEEEQYEREIARAQREMDNEIYGD